MLSAISTQPKCAGSLRSVKYFGNSTLSIGRYSPVIAKSISASVRSTLTFHTNRNPSTIPDHGLPGRSPTGGGPAPASRNTLIAAMDTPKAAAATHIVLTPPTIAISAPPSPGPTM
jgi:hypothetical protein